MTTITQSSKLPEILRNLMKTTDGKALKPKCLFKIEGRVNWVIMDGIAEHRKYQRCSGVVCKAKISTDNKKSWSEAELWDVSAGGLSFRTKTPIEVNSKIYFNISIYNMLSEFNMNLEGTVLREKDNVYAVIFENLDKYSQVQLDELIKSKVTIKNQSQPIFDEDGVYSFIFIQRYRPRGRIKIRI